jgi:nucleotide-binding universal stress UspA family protein
MIVPAASSSDELGQRACEAAIPQQTLKICVLLPEVETAISSLQCAVAATRGFTPLICAVHVGFDPLHTFVSAEEQDIQQLRDIYEGKPEVRVARIKAVLDAFISSESDVPPIQWKNDEGDICSNIVLEACRADLFVIGRPIHLDAADALHSALFDVRRLVLVAPRDASDLGRTIGRHFVVGWKAGDPVKHSVEAAAPWLRHADKVSVLCVAKQGAEPYEASAHAFFDKLGIAAQIIGLQRNDKSVGRQLLAEASQLGGDCLLIGAFKHSALWDAALGGVTRDVLAHANIPILLMR